MPYTFPSILRQSPSGKKVRISVRSAQSAEFRTPVAETAPPAPRGYDPRIPSQVPPNQAVESERGFPQPVESAGKPVEQTRLSVEQAHLSVEPARMSVESVCQSVKLLHSSFKPAHPFAKPAHGVGSPTARIRRTNAPGQLTLCPNPSNEGTGSVHRRHRFLERAHRSDGFFAGPCVLPSQIEPILGDFRRALTIVRIAAC